MLPVLSLNASIKHRQKAWFNIRRPKKGNIYQQADQGRTLIQNSTELLVSLPFYFPSYVLQPETEVAGNVEVCDAYRERSGEAF